MEIITVQYKDSSVLVKTDTGELFEVSLKTANAMNLTAGIIPDRETEDRLRTEAENFSCLKKAVRYLAAGNHSEKEIMDYLIRKKFSRRSAEAALAYLRKHEITDDSTFAETYVKRSTETRAVGRGRVSAELARKGISREQASAALAYFTDEIELDKAIDAAVKKIRTLKGKKNPDRKLSAFLLQRGFSWKTIGHVLDTQEIRAELADTES